MLSFSFRAWRERTARVFLKKNTHLSLIEILCPRIDIGTTAEGRKKKKQSSGHKSGGSENEGIIPHPTFQVCGAKFQKLRWTEVIFMRNILFPSSST